MDFLTIPQAARQTGLSEAEVRERIERGQLRATRRAGVRVIEPGELELRAAAAALTGDSDATAESTVQELLARIEGQAVELAALEARLENAEARHEQDRRRLETSLKEARAATRRGRPDEPGGGVPRGMRESLAPLFAPQSPAD